MVQPEWFDGVQNLLITAGASAPERLVTEIIEHLIADFDGELIDESPVNEGMTFSMPAFSQSISQTTKMSLLKAKRNDIQSTFS